MDSCGWGVVGVSMPGTKRLLTYLARFLPRDHKCRLFLQFRIAWSWISHICVIQGLERGRCIAIEESCLCTFSYVDRGREYEDNGARHHEGSLNISSDFSPRCIAIGVRSGEDEARAARISGATLLTVAGYGAGASWYFECACSFRATTKYVMVVTSGVVWTDRNPSSNSLSQRRI